MHEVYTRLVPVIKSARKYYSQIPCTSYRRFAYITYAFVQDSAFEYTLAKGLVTGFVIFTFTLLLYTCGIVGLHVMGVVSILAFPFGLFMEYEEIKKKVLKPDKTITLVFSRISANCLLFLSSGLSVRRAFAESVAYLEDSCCKKAVEDAVRDLETNSKTSEVFSVLNKQMKHPFVSEFTSILEQVERYGMSSKSDLDRLIRSSWDLRRDVATRSAKEMETKLVFPSMLIFLGVMLMIAVGLILQMQ